MRTKPKVLVLGSVAIGIVAVWVICLMACNSVSNDIPIIVDDGEYIRVLAEAQKLSNAALQKQADDQPLDEKDKANLLKAAMKFKGIAAYEPTKFAPFLALGMIYRGLGNYDVAEQHLKQCLNNIPISPKPEVMQSYAEAHYQLAQVLFAQQKFGNSLADAKIATDTDPGNPSYHVATASAMIQLKRTEEAKKEIALALKIDPQNQRANGLAKLLK